MCIVIREMAIQDYDEVLSLWRTSEGVGLSDADSEEGVARFLERNPGLSFVARDGKHLVGEAAPLSSVDTMAGAATFI